MNYWLFISFDLLGHVSSFPHHLVNTSERHPDYNQHSKVTMADRIYRPNSYHRFRKDVIGVPIFNKETFNLSTNALYPVEQGFYRRVFGRVFFGELLRELLRELRVAYACINPSSSFAESFPLISAPSNRLSASARFSLCRAAIFSSTVPFVMNR